MKDLGNYVCEGQMDIFDYLQQQEKTVTESVSPQEEYKESVNKQPVTKHTVIIAAHL